MSESSTTKKRHQYPPVILTIWQDAWAAITQPSKAIRWAMQPFKRSVTYLLYLSIVLAIVSTAYFFITLRPAVESFRDWATTNIPEVSLTDNVLSIADDQTFGFTDSDQFYFKVDTTQSVEDEPKIDSFYEAGLLITSDQIILQEVNSPAEVISIAELELGDFSFDGITIARFIDEKLLPLSYFVIPLVVFAYTFFAKMLYSLVFAVLLFFLSGIKYDLVQLWSIAIYSLTPALLAGYISFIFGPVFGLYTLVFVFYYIAGFGSYLRFKQMKPKV